MGWWAAAFGEWCVAGVGEGEVGPCLDWDTPVGVVVNLAWWIGMAALVVLAIRVVRALLRRQPVDEEELRRIMNPWLFFTTFTLWSGGWILANVAR
jgi:hypothetical protein